MLNCAQNAQEPLPYMLKFKLSLWESHKRSLTKHTNVHACTHTHTQTECLQKALFCPLKHNILPVSLGIPTLVISAASFDVVISISLFGVFLGLTFSEGIDQNIKYVNDYRKHPLKPSVREGSILKFLMSCSRTGDVL